jgi:hypothetical protein
VASLVVDGSEIEVVIKNVGDTAVTDEFWVDVYINPAVPPTAVNQTIDSVNAQGAVWGVISNALPLLPGDTLTLTLGDVYYATSSSRLTLPVPANLPVFAQVDSASSMTSYGAVLESHEWQNLSYNNIFEARSK